MARISINHPDNWLELWEEEEVSDENSLKKQTKTLRPHEASPLPINC